MARTLARMSPAADAATRTARRSTRFVAWVRAWRAGLVPFDELADEIARDEEHLVADAPGTWTDVPLPHGLAVFAKVHPDDIRLVLPAPGAPRAPPRPGRAARRRAAGRRGRHDPRLRDRPAGAAAHVRLRRRVRDGAVA